MKVILKVKIEFSLMIHFSFVALFALLRVSLYFVFQSKNLELAQREKQLNERELRLEIREEELEVAYKKLAINLHKAVDEETAEKTKVC